MKKSIARAALFSTTTLGLPALAVALVMPAAAHAQTVCVPGLGGLLECVDGVTTTVTGTVTAGTVLIPGPGLTATSATDLVANVTGNITTTGNNQHGVLLTAFDDLIFTMDGTVTTLGDNSDGVNLTGATVTADLGDITTQGLNSQGLQVFATEGPTNITVDTIQTEGDLAHATLLRGVGDINLNATALSTGGTDAVAINIASDPAACILLGAGGCDVTAAAESVTTEGFGGIGALIAAAGDTTVNIDVLRTNGDSAAGLDLRADPTACLILGEGACDTAFTVGSLTTNGTDSPGALVRAAGDITANVGVLETNGDRAIGLDLQSNPEVCAILGAGACDTSFVVGTLTTEGAGATGILVRAAGDTTGSVNILETNGDGATGIDIASDPTACVIVGVGACDVGLTANQVTTNGNQAAAVIINTVGDITANLGLINTNGDDSPGVNLIVNPTLCAAIGPGTCVITAVIDDVDTDGDDSPGVEVDGGEDPVVVIVDDVDTDGDDSPGVDVEATGPIDVTTDDVNTGGDDSPGIIVDGDDDPVAVTCGAVVTAGNNSPGVVVSAEGQIDVNCESVLTGGDNSDGIQIDGGTGPVSVTVGPVTTDGIDSDGIDVVTDTGDIDIVAGPVTVTGPGSDGISAVATGCADIGITATSDVLSADGTAILASTLCAVTVTTLPGASVTGADAGIDVTSGTGATITLNDSAQATNGPAIDVDGAAALIDVNAGGSIIGRIDLTDNNDTLNNRGLFDVIGTSNFGGGVDVVNNLAGGTVSSVNGNGVLQNCETFNNAGTITMIDGAANDTLTVCGNYVGLAGANLGIDVGGTAGGLTADRLIVPGNASGTTGVNLNLIAGSAVVDPDGVLIVDAGSATSNPFNLVGPTSAGLINYALLQNGPDTFLVSTPDEAIFDIATMNLMGQDMWYQSSDAHTSCSASRRNDFGVTRSQPFGICAQLYGSEDRTGDNDRNATVFDTDLTFSDRLKTKRRGAQVEAAFHANNFDVGLTAGYGHAKANLASGTRLDVEGHNYGAFAQFGMASGLYGGAMIKRDSYRVRFGNGLIIPSDRTHGKSTGIDGELGWRSPTMGAILDLNAGLSYVRSKMDDFNAGNIAFDNDTMTSMRGRLGARLGWSGRLNPFVDAKLFHEFKGDSDVDVGSGSFADRIEGRGRGTWGRLEAGLGAGAKGGPLLSAWVDLGDVKGWGLRGGFRF